MTTESLNLELISTEPSLEKTKDEQIKNDPLALTALDRVGCSHYSHHRTENNSRPLACGVILKTKFTP